MAHVQSPPGAEEQDWRQQVYPQERNVGRLPTIVIPGPAVSQNKVLTGLKFMQEKGLETNYLQQRARVRPRGRAEDKLPTAHAHSPSRRLGTYQAHLQHSPGRE